MKEEEQTVIKWVKPSHIAKLVNVTPRCILQWCEREKDPLPHIREGRVVRINIDDFWQWWMRNYRVSKKQKENLFEIEAT
jgi:hypothetical protein